MIEIDTLFKRFGTVEAVAGLSLKAGMGEVLGFLGPNGAGKSTTMRMIAGFLAPDEGRIRICDHDIETERMAAQSCLGYLPEGAPAYGEMTPEGFLYFVADARGFRRGEAKEKVEAALLRTALTSVRHRSIETLSKGFKRRVGIAQAIVHDPEVLVMDEPTDGLDPNQKHAVRELIRAMSPKKTIIVSTHILEEVEAICTRAVIIDRGRIVADGTPAALLARSRHHNAATAICAVADADRLEGAIRALSSVAAVERIADTTTVRLTAFPKNGARPVEEIGAHARAESWPLLALTAEHGRLDDVFRAITTDEAIPS